MTDPKLPMRVLIIEDDDALAAMLIRVLRLEGFFVTHARDGVDGLAAYERERPHACLVDALLPRMTGFEVCRAIRDKDGDKVGLAMMSATFRTLQRRTETLAQSGADAFISKPFVLAEVRKRVRDLASRAHAARTPPSSGEPVSAWIEPPKTQPGLPVIAGPYDGAHHVARALVESARAGASGILRLSWEESRLELAFLRGVLVGARDNLRENQLGERLLREGRLSHEELKLVNERIEKGERVAEALVSLGLAEASDVLELIEEQVPDRLFRALSWRRGTMTFTDGEDAAQQLAVDAFDLLALTLRFGFDAARETSADAFLFTHGGQEVSRTHDFDDALALLQQLRPSSRAIAAVLGARGSLDALASRAGPHARDLYALWLAGLIRLDGDPPGSARPIPRPAIASPSLHEVDRQAGERVATWLLRVRGREPWAALGAPPHATVDELRARLDDVVREVGPDALRDRELGRRRAAAKELWHLLDELRAHLARPQPAPPPAAPVRAPISLAPEQEFLDGQIALSLGDPAAAREAFERATAQRPNDPDFNAWLAWAALLSGEDEAFALDLLDTAARAYPQAMRPEFFLGLAASRRGDRAQALAHLEEAAARAPLDVEVKKALSRVRAGQSAEVG